MAKLKLDNGTVLRIKAIKGDKGAVEIIVWDGSDLEDYWYLGTIDTDGIFRACSGLAGRIADGLQYEADGGIKVERG
jgi:hypothetical protein